MKKRLLPLTIASLFALLQPAMAQDPPPQATPTPSATPTPERPPTPSATPTPSADSSSEASTASPEEIKAAEAKNSPSPTATPEPPVAASTPEPGLPEAGPSASPAAGAADADFLPEPTDASLGAPVETAEDSLPASDSTTDDLPDPDNLIPQGVSDADDGPPAPPVAVENKFEKDRKLQVRYQEVKLQALKDPAVRSFNEQAERAKTDEAKRQALREYYRRLFARMTSIDAELKAKCDTMEQAYLRRLGQYRVSPTIPLNPPPTPEPLAN